MAAVLETVVASVALAFPTNLCEIFSREEERDFLGDDLVKFSTVSSSGVLCSIGERDVVSDAGVIREGETLHCSVCLRGEELFVLLTRARAAA